MKPSDTENDRGPHVKHDSYERNDGHGLVRDMPIAEESVCDVQHPSLLHQRDLAPHETVQFGARCTIDPSFGRRSALPAPRQLSGGLPPPRVIRDHDHDSFQRVHVG